MKKIMITLIALLTLAAEAHAMSYEQARNEALFLTDKMAYELNLTDAQYEAAYEINLDYLMCVTNRDNVFGTYWDRRNADLHIVLHAWQWDAFCAATYFYRPLFWEAGYWHFSVYRRYPHRDHFYFGRPHFYASYRGGHSWRMNGGHSYYASHHDHYRPHPTTHDRHVGMRDGWNRGNYHNHHSNYSSTHVTTTNHRHHNELGNHRGTTNHHGTVNSGNHRGTTNHHGTVSSSNHRGTTNHHGNTNRGSQRGAHSRGSSHSR